MYYYDGYGDPGLDDIEQTPENRAVVTGFLVAGVWALFFWGLTTAISNGRRS